MTEDFFKFIEYSRLDEFGNRVINDNAPDKIKEEARVKDNEYFNRTGRHMIIVKP